MATYLVEAFCSNNLSLQILESLVIVSGLIITSIATITGHNSIKTQSLHIIHKYMFYAVMTLAFTLCIGFGFTLCICQSTRSTQWTYITTLTSFSIYGVMITHLYLSWLLRLYLTFKGSSYGKSDIFYRINIVLFIVIVLQALLGVLFYNISMKIIGSILVAVSGFIYFFASLLLLHSFQRELLKLITSRIVTLRAQSKESLRERTSTISLSGKDQKLVRCMAKYIVLGSTSFSTTLLVLIAMLLLFMNLFGYYHMNSTILFHILQLLVMLDVICNVMCIYLQFAFAHRTYIKVCVLMDKCIKKRIQSKAEYKIRQDTYNFYADKFDDIPDNDTVDKMDNESGQTTNAPIEKMSSAQFGTLFQFKKPNSMKVAVPQQSRDISSQSQAESQVELPDVKKQIETTE